MASRRRVLLLGLGAIAGITAIRYGIDAYAPLPDFVPLDDPKGFRRLAKKGETSSFNFNPLLGLGDVFASAHQDIAQEKAYEAGIRANLCHALYREWDQQTDSVPIAIFSDFYCPYCQEVSENLNQLAAEFGGEIHISSHELPILGEPSRQAAKAVLAAKQQGAYSAFQQHLFESFFRPSISYLKDMAESLNLDYDRFIADMKSDFITQELKESAALADIFNIIGTPALIVGRTVVYGRISKHNLRKLIRREKKDGLQSICLSR